MMRKEGQGVSLGNEKSSPKPSLHRFSTVLCIGVLEHEMVIVISISYFGKIVLQSTCVGLLHGLGFES